MLVVHVPPVEIFIKLCQRQRRLFHNEGGGDVVFGQAFIVAELVGGELEPLGRRKEPMRQHAEAIGLASGAGMAAGLFVAMMCPLRYRELNSRSSGCSLLTTLADPEH